MSAPARKPFNPKPGSAISERIAMLNKAREEAEQRALEEERKLQAQAAPPPAPVEAPPPPPPPVEEPEPVIPPEELFLYEEGTRFRFPHPIDYPRAPPFKKVERIYPSFVTAQSEQILQKVGQADPDLRRVAGVEERQRKCSVLHDIKTRDLKSGLRPVEREEKVFEQVLKVNPELNRVAPGLREADRVRKHSVLQDIRKLGSAADGQPLSPLRYGRKRVGGEGGPTPPTLAPAPPPPAPVEPPAPTPPAAPAQGSPGPGRPLMFALPGINVSYESLQQQRKQAMEEEIKRSDEEKKRNLMNAVSVLSGSPVTSTTPTATPFAPQVGRTPLGVALPVAGRPLPGVAPARPPQAVLAGAAQAPPAIEVDGGEDDEDDDDLDDDEEDEEEFEKWAATEGAALLQTPGGAELKVFNSKLEEIKERSRQRKARSVARRAAANPLNVFNKAQGALQGKVAQPVLIPQASVPLSTPTGLKLRTPQPALPPLEEEEKKAKKKKEGMERYEEHMNFNPLAAALGDQS